MFLNDESATAWTEYLNNALQPSCRLRLTGHQIAFLGVMRSNLQERGPSLPITTRELASMKYLANHATGEAV